MVNITYHPERDPDRGQFYFEVVKSEFGEDKPPKDGQWARLGYWCDRKHLETVAKEVQRAFDKSKLPYVVSRNTDGYNIDDPNGARLANGLTHQDAVALLDHLNAPFKTSPFHTPKTGAPGTNMYTWDGGAHLMVNHEHVGTILNLDLLQRIVALLNEDEQRKAAA